jgi:hypothetical protein
MKNRFTEEQIINILKEDVGTFAQGSLNFTNELKLAGTDEKRLACLKNSFEESEFK